MFIGLYQTFILINDFNQVESLNILSTNFNKNMRSLNITMSNPKLFEGDKLFKAIYNTLMNSDVFFRF
jgi:hypothetical protein